MLLLVGLGNPGREYSSHRHNVGFMVIDALARKAEADVFRAKFSGEYAKGRLGKEDVVLLKPLTYMNESGRSVQAAIAFFKPETSQIVVIHDELDLPFGTLRLKVGGGHAGHNGLRSIMACIGTGEFGRMRFGIGRPPAGFRGETADFVLSPFQGVERAELPDLIDKAVSAIGDVASKGFSSAMNAQNVRPKPPKPPKAEKTEKAEKIGQSAPPPPGAPKRNDAALAAREQGASDPGANRLPIPSEDPK